MIDIGKIIQLARQHAEQSPDNAAAEGNLSRIYDPPLVAVAAADDPLFNKMQEPGVVGPHFCLPTDWLPNAKSVISYFLPFTEEIRSANHIPGWPAPEWVYGRFEGEAYNAALSMFLVKKIQEEGAEAVAPSRDKKFYKFDTNSNWSERHIAFIAGLGTFGLSRSLITEKGCAGRFGSVITTLELETTERRYRDIYEYCNNCLECMQRCPSQAITQLGKDKNRCSEYLRNIIMPRYAPRYGCGKCQTAVACESCIPEKN